MNVGDVVTCKRKLIRPFVTYPVLYPGQQGVITAVINGGEYVSVDFLPPVEVLVSPDELINHGPAADLTGWDMYAIAKRKAASA